MLERARRQSPGMFLASGLPLPCLRSPSMPKHPAAPLPEVPPEFVAEIRATTDNPFSPEERRIAERLITYPDMARVWQAIGQIQIDLEPDGETVLTLAQGFLYKVAAEYWLWESMDRTPTKKAVAKLKALAKRAEALAAALKGAEPQVRLFHPGRLTADEILRKQVKVCITASSKTLSSYQGTELHTFLRVAAAQLRRTDQGYTRIRPTKPKQGSAQCTYLVRSLSQFFRHQFGKPRYEFVAATVSAVLDLKPPLDADHTRKLVKDLV